MRHFMICRRTYIATLAILALTTISLVRGFDVSMALATVAIGLAASNAVEGVGKARANGKN